jgi:signal transduction histidine kinase
MSLPTPSSDSGVTRGTVRYDPLPGRGADPREPDALARAIAETELLTALVRATAGAEDLPAILEAALERLSRVMRFTGGSIALVEDDMLVVRAAIGPYADRALGQRLPRGRGRSWQVIESLTPFLSSDLLADGLRTVDAAPGTELRSYLAVPLTWQDRAFGMLEVDSTWPGAFGDDDLRLLRSVGVALGGSVEMARRYSAEVRARERIEAIAAERDAALQQMNDMVAVLSHDLRDPLGTIFTSASFLLDVMPEAGLGTVSAREQIAIIHRQADRMNRLISDLLDLDRITRGALRVSPEACDAGGLLTDAELLLRPGVEQQDLRFAVDIGASLGAVLADRDRVMQVFANLVGNAVKFTPHGGEIVLGASSSEDGVRFSVSDTGPGIPEAERVRIFQRFWQGHSADRRGIGLGLTIARGIVEAHGGTIGLASPSGTGTTFEFTLPAAGAAKRPIAGDPDA